MVLAYIALGSNIGDRLGYVQQAYSLLNHTNNIDVLESSTFYETEPVGLKEQDWFVNAVIKIETTLSPQELMGQCLRIEKQLGRKREINEPKWGPRTIDLDILFYDSMIINEENLIIPHPRLHERAHVLVPFLEIDPGFIHPVIGKTITELYNEIEEPEEVYLYGTRGLNF